MESKGYYSVASRRWVSHAEVIEAENAIEALRLENQARKLRREAFEVRAAEAAAAGDFAQARAILAEGHRQEGCS